MIHNSTNRISNKECTYSPKGLRIYEDSVAKLNAILNNISFFLQYQKTILALYFAKIALIRFYKIKLVTTFQCSEFIKLLILLWL